MAVRCRAERQDFDPLDSDPERHDQQPGKHADKDGKNEEHALFALGRDAREIDRFGRGVVRLGVARLRRIWKRKGSGFQRLRHAGAGRHG